MRQTHGYISLVITKAYRKKINTEVGNHDIFLLNMRGIAALSVLMVHIGQNFSENEIINRFNPLLDLGKHGVALFFVLSAYLLTNNLASKEPSLVTYSRYLTSRFLRIYPAYFVSLIVLVAALTPNKLQILTHLFLIQNITAETFGGINYPYWSIPIEFTFYILLPIYLWKNNFSRRTAIISVLLFIGPVWQFIGGILRLKYGFDQSYDWSCRLFFITALPAFTLGFYQALGKKIKSIDLIINIFGFLGIVEVLLRCISIFIPRVAQATAPLDELLHGSLGYLVYGSLSILAIKSKESKLALWITKSPILKASGVISYSIYLLQVPILMLIAEIFGTTFISLGIAVAMLILVSTLSYFTVEKPMVKYAKRNFKY